MPARCRIQDPRRTGQPNIGARRRGAPQVDLNAHPSVRAAARRQHAAATPVAAPVTEPTLRGPAIDEFDLLGPDGGQTPLGAQAATPQAAPRAPIPGLDRGVPALVVRAGADNAEVVVLEKDIEIKVGRGKSCQIRLSDARASRVHCRVYLQDGQWTIEDMGSANGTLVDGEFLAPRTPRALEGGEALVVGSTSVHFVTDAHPQPA